MPVKPLKAALATLNKARLKKGKASILDGIYFQDGHLRVTDLEIELQWNARISKDFELAVPFKELEAALKTAKPSDTVLISHDPTDAAMAIVTHPQATIRVKRMDFDQVPPYTDAEELGKPILLPMLDSDILDLLPFVSTDANRYVLNSVLLDPKGCFVACDGRTLLRIPSAELLDLKHKVMLPLKTMELFKSKPMHERPASLQLLMRRRSKPSKFGDEADFAQIVLGDGEWTVTTKLVEGNFPNYEQVIPKDMPGWVGFLDVDNAKQIAGFLGALPKDCWVRFNIDGGKITMTTTNGHTPECSTTLNVMTPSEESVEITFNRTFLLDTIAAECLTWKIKDDLSPLLATGRLGRTAIVMPLRTEKSAAKKEDKTEAA
jgi:DNA polymerase III sliding clamp (beta) subunit (PCNA family)